MSEEPQTSALARLEDAGELVGQGGFTLDAAAARTKLASHQLPDDESWWLLVCEAAELARVERIVLVSWRKIIELELWGEGATRLLPAEHLEDWHSWAFPPSGSLVGALARLVRARRELVRRAARGSTAGSL